MMGFVGIVRIKVLGITTTWAYAVLEVCTFVIMVKQIRKLTLFSCMHSIVLSYLAGEFRKRLQQMTHLSLPSHQVCTHA